MKKVLVKDLRGWGVATPITLPLDLPLSTKNYEEPKGTATAMTTDYQCYRYCRCYW